MGVQPPLIVGRDGLRGWLETPLDDPRNQGRAIVRLDSGERIYVPISALSPLPDRTGYALALSRSDLARAFPTQRNESLTVPVIQEEVHVDKRVEELGRVRVHKRVEEQTQTIEHPVLRERVSIEHVPLNQFVDVAPPMRTEGDVLIVPVVEEVLVVDKRLVVREEIRISKQVVQEQASEDVVVRRESVDVERVEVPHAPR